MEFVLCAFSFFYFSFAISTLSPRLFYCDGDDDKKGGIKGLTLNSFYRWLTIANELNLCCCCFLLLSHCSWTGSTGRGPASLTIVLLTFTKKNCVTLYMWIGSYQLKQLNISELVLLNSWIKHPASTCHQQSAGYVWFYDLCRQLNESKKDKKVHFIFPKSVKFLWTT